LHTQPNNWEEKIHAAYTSGCRRYDAAIKGYGGCPMAKDDLTGNMPTENLIYYFDNAEVDLGLDKDAFLHAMVMSNEVFPIT
jgi:hydroxymethylglutaryl-CoA lyase